MLLVPLCCLLHYLALLLKLFQKTCPDVDHRHWLLEKIYYVFTQQLVYWCPPLDVHQSLRMPVSLAQLNCHQLRNIQCASTVVSSIGSQWATASKTVLMWPTFEGSDLVVAWWHEPLRQASIPQQWLGNQYPPGLSPDPSNSTSVQMIGLHCCCPLSPEMPCIVTNTSLMALSTGSVSLTVVPLPSRPDVPLETIVATCLCPLSFLGQARAGSGQFLLTCPKV